jgi:glutathione S-transferase
MILYGSPTSPFVRHVRIALEQTKLEWHLETVTAETIDNSPTKRVPFFTDGNVTLTDSAVIVRYIRGRTSQPFLEDIAHYELFAMATSVLDTAINLYLMNIGDTKNMADVKRGTSVTGFNPQQYVERQQQRIISGLQALNDFDLAKKPPYNDGEIRLACLLGWGVYRQAISLDGLDNLKRFMSEISEWPPCAETAPDL